MSSTNVLVISSLRMRRYSQRRNKKNCTREVKANVHQYGSIGSRMVLSGSSGACGNGGITDATLSQFRMNEETVRVFHCYGPIRCPRRVSLCHALFTGARAMLRGTWNAIFADD